MRIIIFIDKFIDKVLRIDKKNARVDEIKTETTRKVDDATAIMKEAGKLQKRVMERTATYYIGKGMGVIK